MSHGHFKYDNVVMDFGNEETVTRLECSGRGDEVTFGVEWASEPFVSYYTTLADNTLPSLF